MKISGDMVYLVNRSIDKIVGWYCMPAKHRPLSSMRDPYYTPDELMTVVSSLQKDVSVLNKSLLGDSDGR